MNPIIKKNGTNYGIGLGVLSIVLGTVTYALNLYGTWWLGIAAIVLTVVIFVMLLINTKKEMGGVFSFKEAFTTFFLAAVISLAMGVFFNIVLYNVIDPEAKETVKEETIKASVSMMEKLGAPASEINKAVDKMEAEDNYSVGSQLKGAAVAIIVYSLFGMLLALIFKSSPKYQE